MARTFDVVTMNDGTVSYKFYKPHTLEIVLLSYILVVKYKKHGISGVLSLLFAILSLR
jgi:hypothetical protein